MNTTENHSTEPIWETMIEEAGGTAAESMSDTVSEQEKGTENISEKATPAAQTDKSESEQADDCHGTATEESTSEPSAKSRKKLGKFGKFLLIYSAVFLVIAAAGLCVWWQALSQYEASQPKYKIEEITAEFDTYLSDSLFAVYKDTLTEYENWEEVFAQTLSPAFGCDYKYKKAVKHYTAQNPVYTIYTDKDIANVTLGASEQRSSFGFAMWEVISVEVVADISNVSTIDAVLQAPSDASVRINGIPLESTSLTGTSAYPSPLKWENASDLPSYCTYRISGLFSEPEIEADISGTALTVIRSEDSNSYICDYPQSMRHTVSITAPYDSTVKLGGITLSEEHIAQDSIAVEDAVRYDNAHYVKYSVEGLLTHPEVSVKASDGRALDASECDEKKENFVFSYTDSDSTKMTVLYPTNGTIVSINGVTLGDDVTLLTGAQMPKHPKTADVSKYISGAVPFGCFTLERIYGEPSISVVDSDGNALQCKTESSEGAVTYFFSPASSEQLKSEYEKYAVAYTEDYIKYASGGYMVVDQTFAVAASHLLPDSPAYEKLESTKFSFGQNKPYTVKKQEITTYGYTKWGENCFSCLVDFAVDVTTSYNVEQKDQHDEVKGMELFFSYINGKWQIVGLNM